MGVPKFFRFISERYPCISELLPKDAHNCEFDNLYLDMNGIVHMCSHPDDNNPHFRVSEEKMFRDIFHYVSYLFQIINPKKLFYMAIDGVAPRAKMNQQRCRRFQSAREAQEALNKAVSKGEILPDTKRFDSNCITPGTVFMVRLHEQLRYFIKHKITTDHSWAKCRVILSGHETPGEGEHKIMDHIRYLKSQPDHDPNTRHCLYGLDADLIMLGFCTHEPNFSILREEVIFKKNVSRPTSPDLNNFYLLHLSLLKDYIELEFFSLKDELSFPFDMDKLIDDWILMGFLVGNDFIPHLPNIMIQKNALPQLYDVYKAVLPTLDGYLNENGILNLRRFEVYLKKLADIDRQQFEEVFADLKYLESKSERKMYRQGLISSNHVPDDNETFGVDVEEIKKMSTSGFQNDLQNLIKSTNNMVMESDDDDLIDFGGSDDDARMSDNDLFETEFVLHKRDYYMKKLDFAIVTEDVIRLQAEGYIRAIQWILNYYYQGCCSWSWFFPHHYAPFLSDLVNFSNLDIQFEFGKPFAPFEQLLAVLPAASKDLLPEAYHNLMTSPDSPIYHYYPTEFETDLNGKIQQWEAVVLIPFIVEEELLSAMKTCYDLLTDEEKQRNIHGPALVYEFTAQEMGMCQAPAYFPAIHECHSIELPMWNKDIMLDPSKVIRGALPNKYRNAFFPGVPTLKHIDFKLSISKARVKIFEFPSRNDNFVLDIEPLAENPSIESLASKFLGKIVWVGWPYIIEAKVLTITNNEYQVSYATTSSNNTLTADEITSMSKVPLTEKLKLQWEGEKSHVNRHYVSRLGINTGDVDITIHAVNVKGYKYTSSTEGQLLHSVEWCTVPVLYPIQTVLTNIEVAPIARPKMYKTIEEAFPIGDSAFIIVGPFYGSMAEIVDLVEIAKTGRIKVNVITEPEPDITLPDMIAIHSYVPLRGAAAKCGISSLLFTRITSSMYVVPREKEGSKKNERNINIGLGLKFTKTEEEVVGYCHKIEKNWQYSLRCISLVTDYVCRFYEMFQKLERFIAMENINEHDIFTEQDEYTINDVLEWIGAQSFKNYPIRKCSTIGLDPEEMRFIHDTVDAQFGDILSQKKKLGLKVKPHVLFKADLRVGNIPPDFSITRFRLFDRIVNVSPQCSVPLGYKGTVVSIIKHNDITNSVKLTDNLNSDPSYLVQFDRAFPNGTTLEGVPGNRLYVMRGFNMLNITAGCQAHNKTNNKVQINNTKTVGNGKMPFTPEKMPALPSHFHNLRTNDGHNSAFANYANPVKAQQSTPPYTKILPRPVKFEVPPFQVNMFSLLSNQNQGMQERCINQDKQNIVMSLPNPNFQSSPNVSANQSPMAIKTAGPMQNNGFLNDQLNANNDSGTRLLRSLLKINDAPNNERTPEKPKSHEPIKTQEFYRSPPSKTQLPFPVKLIDDCSKPLVYNQQNNFVATTPPRMTDNNKPSGYVISTPFVPLQVTKKKVYTNTETSNVNVKTKPVSTEVNSDNVNRAELVQKSQADVKPVQNSVKKKNRRRPKSRIAANFDNLNN
ncbi:5'-3' exoribonuclease pacman [Arctopsyche grandis]|uniref:5'-3' exoribonuclease pacman n=1 Tax=Arctopsyche grandis TaxID=121162 RepID=UPI00406D8988